MATASLRAWPWYWRVKAISNWVYGTVYPIWNSCFSLCLLSLSQRVAKPFYLLPPKKPWSVSIPNLNAPSPNHGWGILDSQAQETNLKPQQLQHWEPCFLWPIASLPGSPVPLNVISGAFSSFRCLLSQRSQHALQLVSAKLWHIHTSLKKKKGSNIASWDVSIYGASVYLESLQRKTTKELEWCRVVFNSLLPFTSWMSVGKWTSLSLCSLIYKLGIPFLLHSFWRVQ